MPIPRSGAQWRTAGLLALGVFCGWVTHPVLWLAMGPLRAASFALARSSWESDYGRLPDGDGGASRGPLHFHISNVGGDNLIPRASRRDSAFWSGWYFCAYLQAAALSGGVKGLLWLLAWALPIVGVAYVGRAWTNNPFVRNGGTGPFEVPPGEVLKKAFVNERDFVLSFAFWRLLTIGVPYAAREYARAR